MTSRQISFRKKGDEIERVLESKPLHTIGEDDPIENVVQVCAAC